VLQRLFGPPSSAAARTKQIDANFDPLHQGRHFLHRAPNVMGELRPGVFHCFQGSGNNAIGAHQLATQAVRSLGENAVDLLGLSAGQVHDVRGVSNHFGNFRLCIFQQDLYAA